MADLDLGLGLGQLSVCGPTGETFVQYFGGLRESVPGPAIALSGGEYPLPLNLPSLGTPGIGVF
ncbi:MAG: hypothetical protein M3Z75_17785 [Actinomycetota bacterium]|nr:hypothetical protein [Actinomycetota bacterium]